MKRKVVVQIFAAIMMAGFIEYNSGPTSVAAVPGTVTVAGGVPSASVNQDHSAAASLPTTTPIKHLVVIFQENASFDHYFGTYPDAANALGEPAFAPRGNTPPVNGLTPQLLTTNPNMVQPFRLDRSQALTCSQVHNYLPEQQAQDAGKMDQFVQYPAVSFLKAPGYQDGHPSSSDPLDEQEFLVNSINHLESLPSWKTTAIIVQWDDSDGWYDHVRGPIVNHSNTPLDAGCGTTTDGPGARCGYGPRLPYLVISSYAQDNFVDHTLIDQTSTTRFIEDNWLGGKRLSTFDDRAGSILTMFDFSHPSGRRLFLDPQMGTPLPDEGAFEVIFTSAKTGQGTVYFGSGPGCSGLVEVATRDAGSGTTSHRVLVLGNDLPGTVGDNGIVPGTTYWYETVTVTSTGLELDNNAGNCYSIAIPPV